VDGGHETLNNTEVVVDDLGKGSSAVGSAGSVGKDFNVLCVFVKVDTADEHGSIS
jgi:hypothetical protein